MKYQDMARMAVVREINRAYGTIVPFNIDYLDVYVVWACHILGNEKYLISTNIPDTRYYEVTVDTKDKKVMYVDCYEKTYQEVIDDIFEL